MRWVYTHSHPKSISSVAGDFPYTITAAGAANPTRTPGRVWRYSFCLPTLQLFRLWDLGASSKPEDGEPNRDVVEASDYSVGLALSLPSAANIFQYARS